MYCTALLDNPLKVKAPLFSSYVLFGGGGSFEVVADSDLLWVFIYTVQVFIGSANG